MISVASLFRDDAMKALANEDNIGDLHIAQVRFGSDVFLQPGTERFAKPVSEGGKGNCQRNEQESPTGRFSASQRRPGKSRGESRGSREVGAAAFMDSESAFAGFESSQRFGGCSCDIFQLKITEQKKASRVGMACHGNFMRACQYMQRGMFKRVITPGFKEEWEIE